MTKLRKKAPIKQDCLRHNFISAFTDGRDTMLARREGSVVAAFIVARFGSESHLGPQAAIHRCTCSLVLFLPSVLHGLGTLKSTEQ